MKNSRALIPSLLILLLSALPNADEARGVELETVKVAADKKGFVLNPSGNRYVPWGHNYASVDILERLAKDPERVERAFAAITGIRTVGSKQIVRGVSHDNGEIATVTVNGLPAEILSQHAGDADWTITLEVPSDDRFLAQSVDRLDNSEQIPYQWRERHAH